VNELIERLRQAYRELQETQRQRWQRRASFGDLISDRSENARTYGFGEGTTCYDNVLILGAVSVGRHVWIGPNVILDGSGGLTIGDYVSISAGVQIYSHDTVAWATSGGTAPIAHAATGIGSHVYIGPGAVIQMGVSIGDGAVIGALSFVNSDVPAGARAFGNPARLHGQPAGR